MEQPNDQAWADLDQEIETGETTSEPSLDNKLDEMDALLGGQDEPARETNRSIEEETETTANSEQASIQDLAAEQEEPDDGSENSEPETSGTEVNYDQEIPMPDNMEAMTVGQLKDRVYEVRNAEQRIEQVTAEQMTERKVLSDFVEMVGIDKLPQEAVNMLQQRRQSTMLRENKAMTAANPEWSDMATFQADSKEMLSLSQQYGFSESDYNGIIDHRHIQMLKDFAKLKARVSKAEQTLQPSNKKSRTKPHVSKTQAAQQRQQAAQETGNLSAKLSAIDELIT